MYIILVTIANWTYAKEDFYEIIKFMPIQENFFEQIVHLLSRQSKLRIAI